MTDPRVAYTASQDWVLDLLQRVPADRWDDPTPCDEFTVAQLASHTVATLDRAAAIAAGHDPMTMPRSVDAPDGDWAALFAAHLPAVRAAWTDDALDAMVIAPPGIRVPGRDAVLKYANELLVHGWDLAVAIGVDAEAPAGTAEPVLEQAAVFLPAEPRGGFVPFAAVVEPAPDAGPTERLANWNGRRRPS